jgi:multidrug efflux pump subunit AcrB
VLHRDIGESRTQAVRLALREITVPLVGSTITPVVVFLPLISVTGVTGSFFRALAITMTASLLTSLLLALTWTPGLSLVLLKHRRSLGKGDPSQSHGDPGRLMRHILHWHSNVLGWSLRRPVALFGICLVLIGGTYFAYQGPGSDLLPEMDEGAFILDYIMQVIGIVAKNGILLLDADERYRKEGLSGRDAMVHAAQRRLRPIVMTATAAICGVLPLAFALGAGSQMLQPLAIAVIGGLLISMVLSLIVTPVVYYLLTSRSENSFASA